MKHRFALAAVFLAGAYYTAYFFAGGTPAESASIRLLGGTIWPGFRRLDRPIGDFMAIVGNFAFLLGVINILRIHGRRILRRERDWWWTSGTVYISFFGILALCIASRKGRGFYADYVNTPLVASIMSLLAFYITFAAYRAFKLRTFEGVVMLWFAVIIMLGRDSAGNLISHGGLPLFANWLTAYVHSPIMRAFNLGVAIGSIAIACRIWLGIDRGFIARG